MASELVQIGPAREFDAARRSLLRFFAQAGARSFSAEELHPHIEQLCTWFFMDGETGNCLRFMSERCLTKVLGGKNDRHWRQFRSATEIFASRIDLWLQNDDYDFTCRWAVASHADRWADLVRQWSIARFPGHVQLATELKPRLTFCLREFASVKQDSNAPTSVVRDRQYKLF